MATFVPESSYVLEAYSSHHLVTEKLSAYNSQATSVIPSANYGYNETNFSQNNNQFDTPSTTYPKESFINSHSFNVKTEPKSEYNQSYDSTNNSFYYTHYPYNLSNDISSQNSCYYSNNSYTDQWPKMTEEDKSQHTDSNHLPIRNSSQELFNGANYAQPNPNQQLSSQTPASYNGYYNSQGNFNYTQQVTNELWNPITSLNTTVPSIQIKSELMQASGLTELTTNQTDPSRHLINMNECIPLNSSETSSSTCSPNSGLNQNSSSRKKVVSESTSSNPSSNSSLSSSRSSMSSLSSDALTVNNNYKASLNEMYFNNTNFKLDSKCKEKYQASCSHSNSIKRKFSDELIKNSTCTVCDRTPHLYDGSCQCNSTEDHSIKRIKTGCESSLETSNLSVEIAHPASSPSNSNSSYTSLVATTSNVIQNFQTFVSALLAEIDRKKQAIREADSEVAIKTRFIELTLSVTDFILKSTNTDYKACGLNKTEFQMNRELMVAYTYLIDEELSSLAGCLNPYELRIKESLKKIYSYPRKIKPDDTESSAEKLLNSFDFTDFNNQTAFPNLNLNVEELNYGFNNLQDCEMLNLSNINDGLENMPDMPATTLQLAPISTVKINQTTTELKMLHFLILLFTSFLSLNDFIHLNKQQRENERSLNVAHCQKFLLQLLDRLCEDRSVKMKILLSISEIEFY